MNPDSMPKPWPPKDRESRDPLSVLRETVKIVVATVYDESIALQIADEAGEAIAQVEALVKSDREVDAIEDEVRRAYMAGPRPNSYGTGWELRDAAAAKDRERRLEAAHERRRAALQPFTPTDSEGCGHGC